MSFNLDDVNIGGQLHVGTGGYPAIKEGRDKINGSAGIEGPVVIGPPNSYGSTEATLMVGALDNKDPDCPKADHVVKIKGPSTSKDVLYIDGDVHITGEVDFLWQGRLADRFREADALPKKFDIVHPSQEGKRLAHACIEGAEVAIYHRGRVRNEKVIVLPSYWKDLVHINSITVQLQPVGAHQDIIVKRWDDEKVYLQARGGMPIDCFYHVYAERKDINPLVVAYTGETWEDYPDRDSKNPDYAGQNTITG